MRLCATGPNKAVGWLRPLLTAMLLAPLASAFAAAPQDGYFYGIEMEPVGNADISVVEQEPAVALLFAIDQKTAELTQQFDAWYQHPDRPDVNAFAIGVVPDGISPEVALTVINQRNLQMPVFLVHADMLLGDDARLLVLNEDREIARFLTLNWADAYEALEQQGVDVSSAPLMITQAPEPTPAPAETPVATLPDTTITTTTETTTTVVSPASPTEGESMLLGGEDSDGIYVNNIYGFRVQFPPGWQFRVAGKRDGAVAVAPRGSDMDMRIWAQPAESGINSSQDYVDRRLESIAKNNNTRVHVERHVRVLRDGRDSVDVTYTYTKPLDPDAPERGGLVWRGRMLVLLDDGFIKAAGVNAPGGEFMAAFPLIQSFIHSFRVSEGDKTFTPEYSDETII